MTDTITEIVHSFTMADAEDPDLYAAEPLYKWEKSEEGKWVMEHAVEQPIWQRIIEQNTYMYRYVIKAKFTKEDYIFWKLKFR